MGGFAWTKEEELTLSRLWPFSAKEEILEALPGRPWTAIGRHAAVLRIKRSRTASNQGDDQVDPIFKRLREIRERRRITREELADKLGYHRVIVARWELGEAKPNWFSLRAWLDALQCDLALTERARRGL